MASRRIAGWIPGILAVSVTFVGLSGHGRAREQGRDSAALVVEGVVRDVYRSTGANRNDSLVEVEVTRSELGKGRREPLRVLVPAPGDLLYIHASGTVPGDRAPIRAFLAPRAGGGWEAASADWFDSTSPPPLAENPAPRPSPLPSPTPSPRSSTGRLSSAKLGLTGEGATVAGRYVVKVSGLDRGGPAMKAGLEVGDVIIAVNEKELTGPDSLDAAAESGGTLNLIVQDINTGKGARVALEIPRPAGPSPSPVPSPPPSPAPAGSRRSLGVSAEPVQIGQRTAMRVVRVDPGSPAQRAGLEPGDVIVEANEIPVTGAEPLGAALRKGGDVLNLVVRDTRTGRDTPVKVNLAENGETDSTPAPSPAPVPAPRPSTRPNPSPEKAGLPEGSDRSLGAVTELVFLDSDSAVKISELTPGGPAQRAGLEPGDIIIEANGTPILHPNTLNEELRKGNANVRLIVVKGKTGKKSTVDVSLKGR